MTENKGAHVHHRIYRRQLSFLRRYAAHEKHWEASKPRRSILAERLAGRGHKVTVFGMNAESRASFGVSYKPIGRTCRNLRPRHRELRAKAFPFRARQTLCPVAARARALYAQAAPFFALYQISPRARFSEVLKR